MFIKMIDLANPFSKNTSSAELKRLFVALDVIHPEQLTSKEIETNILTTAARKKAETYFLNINDANKEYAFDILYTLRKYNQSPLSNAIYLHEYAEYVFTKNNGHDYSLAKPKENTFLDFDAHYNAVLIHSYYLFLLAQAQQQPLSLASIIEYDPISDENSKETLLSDAEIFPSLSCIEKEKDSALYFFSELIKAERDLCSPHIFGVPPANNVKPYLWLF